MFAVDKAAFFNLLHHGAEVDHQDNDGETALMIATQHHNNDYVVALLEHGADVNIKNNYGQYALLFAHLFDMEEVLPTLCAWPTVLDEYSYCYM